MPTPAVHQLEPINALGHALGALLFGIFLVLLLRDRRHRGLPGGVLPLAAGALAFSWDFSSLVLIQYFGGAGSEAGRWLSAAGFAALSLLPAVLFHHSLAGQMAGAVRAGYGCGVLAATLHLAGSRNPALLVTTVGFSLLTLLAAFHILRRKREGAPVLPRLLVSMCLFLLAVSILHLRGPVHEDWPGELLVHHASIPLALFVLLQDYRSVLLDAFVRVLANVMLAAALVTVTLRVFPLDPPPPFERLLPVACAVMIGYALLRQGVERGLGALVFRRPDPEPLIRRLRAGRTDFTDGARYLVWAGEQVAEHFQAQAVPQASPPMEDALSRQAIMLPVLAAAIPGVPAGDGVEVVAPLRAPGGEPRMLLLGRRQGGRRWLSDDLRLLAEFTSVISEQMEIFRDAEMRHLVAQAELRALEAQIHPHFLFNALNTLYGIIPREAKAARQVVLDLSDILRFFLRTEKKLVTVEEEIRVVRSYLQIEALRMGSKLRTEIMVDPRAAGASIPALTIEPLVENAVKYGVAPNAAGGWVKVGVDWKEGGAIEVRVHDSGTQFPAESRGTAGAGVGLANVRRRLELSYGSGAELTIESGSAGTLVAFEVPAPVESAI
ncbi:MAG: histidine kinase [Bryobacter sp.]|nr:histidine kinase [Bryobacter sp.]